MSMSSLMLESGKSIVGGGYNEEKKGLVEEHLKFIERFTSQLHLIIREIGSRSKN